MNLIRWALEFFGVEPAPCSYCGGSGVHGRIVCPNTGRVLEIKCGACNAD